MSRRGSTACSTTPRGNAALCPQATGGFLEATLAALRAQIAPGGQREVLLGDLPSLSIPTLVVWGARDRVFPRRQAQNAADRLREGSLAFIPGCGHLPQVERPDRFAAALGRFLGEKRRH